MNMHTVFGSSISHWTWTKCLMTFPTSNGSEANEGRRQLSIFGSSHSMAKATIWSQYACIRAFQFVTSGRTQIMDNSTFVWSMLRGTLSLRTTASLHCTSLPALAQRIPVNAFACQRHTTNGTDRDCTTQSSIRRLRPWSGCSETLFFWRR